MTGLSPHGDPIGCHARWAGDREGSSPTANNLLAMDVARPKSAGPANVRQVSTPEQAPRVQQPGPDPRLETPRQPYTWDWGKGGTRAPDSTLLNQKITRSSSSGARPRCAASSTWPLVGRRRCPPISFLIISRCPPQDAGRRLHSASLIWSGSGVRPRGDVYRRCARSLQ